MIFQKNEAPCFQEQQSEQYLPKKGGMSLKSSVLPYKKPMPVGPHIWSMIIP